MCSCAIKNLHTHRARLATANTEWPNCKRSAWARDRWLRREKLWEKKGLKTRLKNAKVFTWGKDTEYAAKHTVQCWSWWRRPAGSPTDHTSWASRPTDRPSSSRHCASHAPSFERRPASPPLHSTTCMHPYATQLTLFMGYFSRDSPRDQTRWQVLMHNSSDEAKS